MKKFFLYGVFAVVSVVALSSCCLKILIKNSAGITVSSAPATLALKGDKVEATYTIDIPAGFFAKSAVVKVTPYLKTSEGETALTPLFLQGESVKDNYKVVAYKTASQVSDKVSFVYKPSMKRSTLILRFEAACKAGEKFEPIPGDKIAAEGISTVQTLADQFAKMAYCKDNFKRVTSVSEEAHIMYTINSSVVRSSEMNSDDIATLEQFIKDNTGVERKTISDVYAKAYASPDGPLKLNDKLSTSRGASTEKAVAKKFKKNEVPAKSIQVDALGEDWAGFKELVQASDIEQKNLILQILAMTSDPEKRDAEIQNLSAVFEVLAEKILPQLRRSKLQVNVDIEGLSDEEMKAAVKSDVSSLKLEEMLYAATLYKDNATKAKIYKAASVKFADCFRVWNNLGATLAKQGNVNEAKAALRKAAALNHSSNEVINNLGAIALYEGDNAEAKKYFASISTPESKYNMGLVNLAEGNYAAAVKSLNGYNLAVAQFCNGDVAKAKATVATLQSPAALYLKAIIASSEGNQAEVVSNLKAAIAKNKSYKAQAACEVEFAKFAAAPEFAALVK